MPLVRFEVKNEYGLAGSKLYRMPFTTEDPKPALDGLAVAGLVGILRQLGDLAEFGADVFRDLHEQVMITGTRGRKISSRIQLIESALPSLEKAVQDQKSHIHFAYIAGCDWRATIQTEQSQLIYSELPQYMLDSYEECCNPPQLHLLDKFDSAGAGACLRRYSDPSYFRKAIASSESAKHEKIKRRQKKGSGLRSREIRKIIRPSETSSTQFVSPGTDHLNFSVENISLTDTIPKSEVERDSTFSDLETRVNIQVAHPPSIVDGELEYNESLASTSSINPGDPLVSVLHNEPDEDTPDDDSQRDSLKQQSVPSSCSVMWDEKTEIVKPTSPKTCDEARVDWVLDADSLPLNFDSLTLGCENSELGNSNEEYIEFDIGTVSVSLSSGNRFDEVTSETENYMDANNTLESETEMDDDCQTKQELKLLSNSIFADFKSKESELIQTSASCLDYIDAPTPTDSFISTNDNSPPSLSNFSSVDGFDHGQSMCPTGFVPKHDSYNRIDYCRSHISNVSGVSGSEGLVADTFPGSSTVNEKVKLIENPNVKIFKPHDPPAASLQVPSFSCWTNGEILGVEPSKPPDFILLHGRSVANSEAPVMSREGMTRNSCYADQNIKLHGISVKQNSQDSFHELPINGSYALNHEIAQEESNATGAGSILPGSGNIESQSNGCDQSISASISHLAHRFLSNNLQRRISVNHVDVLISSELVNADFTKSQEISFQNEHQRQLNGFISHASCGVDKEKTEVGSSSPPLEHMKISFHPMNGLQTSNLKLELSSVNLHDSVSDLTFPSFQLIPGPSTSLLDSGAESDDDTFCISSYSSPDLFSLHSESNYEPWGEVERSGSQKHEVSDHSCRISSTTTSMCRSLEFEKMDRCSIYPAPESENLEDENGTVSIGSNPVSDIPEIDSVTFAKSQHQEICDSPSVVSIDFNPVSPNELPLPPLPPMQWRVLKPLSSFEDKSSNKAALISSSVTLTQKEQDELRSTCNAEVLTHYIKKTHFRQNLNAHRGHNRTSKEPDEIVDLLHQIRTKSFNLRRTVIKQPNQIPGPAASANVIAILKKADVVCQAFVSNNNARDDDSWSES